MSVGLAVSIMFVLSIGFLVFGYLTGIKHATAVIVESYAQNKPLIPMYILEIEKGVHYLFDKATNSFACQGNTMEELGQELNKLTKVAFILHPEDGNKVYYTINGKIKTQQKAA